MNWRRMALVTVSVIVALFVLMFYSGIFMHGDP